jgi:CRISPR/Cas system-associated endonuclease Cas1
MTAGIIDDKRDVLMGIEGAAGRLYWQAVGEIIGGKTEFMGREHRGATDMVNAALNYGYGILYGNVWGAALNMIAARVLERMVSTEKHNGKEYQIRSIIQMQARRLGSFLRGGKSYEAFRFQW